MVLAKGFGAMLTAVFHCVFISIERVLLLLSLGAKKVAKVPRSGMPLNYYGSSGKTLPEIETRRRFPSDVSTISF